MIEAEGRSCRICEGKTRLMLEPLGETNVWRMDGARALVVGGSRGIGRAVVEELAALGAAVGVVSRTPFHESDGAAPAAGGPALEIRADVATAEGRQALLEAWPVGWDRLDVLVHAAGINVRKPTVEFTPDEYARILDTNLTAPFEVTRALQPRLAAARQASVVLVGSVAGQVSIGSGSVYAMSKAALEQMARTLAVEWGRAGIRVNVVSPWYTRTGLVAPLLSNPDVLARILDRTPLGRIAEPGEVARAIAFLCLPASSYVTGHVINVDGGFSAYGFSPRPL
jgi:Tropinone reductase 1